MPKHYGRERENYTNKRGKLNEEERIFVARKRARERNPRKPRKRG